MLTTIIGIFRNLSMLIDSVLAWFVGETYQLLLQISQIDLFGSVIGDVKDRMFVLIAVFMLFKLSLSIIKYILDPEQMTASSKGGAELVKRVIIVLALLVSVSWIFEKAMQLQTLVLKSNVIGDIFLGDEHTDGGGGIDQDVSFDDDTGSFSSSELSDEDVGNFMSYQLLAGFLDFNRNSETIKEAIGENCNNIFLVNQGYCTFEELSNWSEIETKIGDARTQFKTSKLANIMNTDVLGATYKGEFVFNYQMGISTICLLAASIILAIFTIDVAVRSIKIGFLHLIAPLPIISYIDPNQKNDMFGKWTKTCISTYVELFIKLAALYFVIGIVKRMHLAFIENASAFEINSAMHPLLYPTVLLGLLVFLVRISKIIEDITGFKIQGGTLKDLKSGAVKVTNAVTSVTSVPLAMVGGFTANTLARGISMGNRADEDAAAGNRWSVGRWAKETSIALGSGLAGGFMAMGRTGFANYKSGGKAAFGNMRAAITKGSVERNLRMEQGYGYFDRVADKLYDMAQIKNETGTTGTLSKAVKQASLALQDAKQAESSARHQLELLANNGRFSNKYSGTLSEASETVRTSDGYLQKKYENFEHYTRETFANVKEMLKNRYGMEDDYFNELINNSRSEDSAVAAKALKDMQDFMLGDEQISQRFLTESQFNEVSASLDRYIAKDAETKQAEKNFKKLSDDENRIKNSSSGKK